jgi:hypothetical protein
MVVCRSPAVLCSGRLVIAMEMIPNKGIPHRQQPSIFLEREKLRELSVRRNRKMST